MRRRLAAGLLTAPLALAFRGAHAQRRLNVAMHASAFERLAMLAERIAKCQVQLAQGVLAERSRRALRAAQHEFDALLPLAESLADGPEAHESFLLLRLLWKELRAWSGKSATRENARQVCERAEEVAWVAGKAARLVKAEGTAQREALSAMHAATLAQRVARLELMKRIARPDARRDADLMDATARLGALLATLVSSPHTLDVEDDLRMAGTQHEFMLAAMREWRAEGAAAAAEAIAKTADHVADSMERAARLYENGPG